MVGSCGRRPRLAAGSRPLRSGAICCLALAAGAAWPPVCLNAQAIDFRFVGIDMFGGAVWAAESDIGVSFGSRLGFADLLGQDLHLGFELDWWSAERTDSDLAVRDALGGLALWFDLARREVVRPFLGGGASLHWMDVSFSDGAQLPDGDLVEASGLEGVRLGASGFAGVAVRLSRTGAIWLVGEYRYTWISDVPFHEARLGFRLSGSDP